MSIDFPHSSESINHQPSAKCQQYQRKPRDAKIVGLLTIAAITRFKYLEALASNGGVEWRRYVSKRRKKNVFCSNEPVASINILHSGAGAASKTASPPHHRAQTISLKKTYLYINIYVLYRISFAVDKHPIYCSTYLFLGVVRGVYWEEKK